MNRKWIRAVPTLMVELLAIGCVFSSSVAAARTAVIEVPFVFFRNSIIVQAKIGGRGPFSMLLDTGADPSLIDLSTAREINLRLAKQGEQGSGGGTDANLAYETKMPLLELGDLTASNVAAAAMDLSKPSAALGRPFQGVLGHSLLNHRIVQIDYPKRIVRFYPSSESLEKTRQETNSRATVLRFKYLDDIVIEGVMVNGRRIAANLDTGSNGSFQLTPAAVKELGLDEAVSQAQVTESTGFNGKTENRQGQVKNITVGGISLDQPAVVFYGKGTGRDNEAWGMRIGNAFLKDYVVTIDYKRGTITLEQ
jgi:predicted aspartyl protease